MKDYDNAITAQEQAAASLFESYQKLMENSLSQVKFDETIICKVVQTFDDEPDHFIVSNEAIRFDAYLDSNLMISEDSQVYVLVPQADYAQRKIITGLYNPETDQEINYDTAYSHLLNYYDTNLSDITATEPVSNPENQQVTTQAVFIPKGVYGKYDYIGFQFGLDVSVTPGKGEYVLHIQGFNENNPNLAVLDVIFTHQDIIGNPYETIPELLQRLIYPMPEGINHEQYLNLKITFEVVGGSAAINNFKIILGYDFAKPEFNSSNFTILPFGDGEATYLETQTTPLHLISAYYDRVDNIIYNKYRPYTKNKAEIYWSKFNDQIGTNYSDILGIGWEDIDSKEQTSYESSFYPNTKQPYEQIKAAIYFPETQNKEKIESNIVKFSLKDEADPGTTSANRQLSLSLGENDDGVYMAYNNSGILVDRETYEVTANFIDKEMKWDDDIETTIIWKIPKSGTLLTLGEGDKLQKWQDKEEIKKEDGTIIQVKQESKWKTYPEPGVDSADDTYAGLKATFVGANLEDKEIYHTLQYEFVKSGYNPSANNTIICEVRKNGRVYTNQIKLSVLQTNTAGTGYTLRIVPADPAQPYMGPVEHNGTTVTKNAELKLKAELYNPSGTKIAINQANLEWSWFQRNEPWLNKYNISISDGKVVSTRTQTGGSEGGKQYTFVGAVDDETKRKYTNVSGKGGAYYYFEDELIKDGIIDVYNPDIKPPSPPPSQVDKVTIIRSDIHVDPYAIVQVTYKNLSLTENETTRNVNLVAYYQVATMEPDEGDKGLFLQGPTAINYNSQGVEPQYEKDIPYLLYGRKDTNPELTWGIQVNSSGYNSFPNADNSDKNAPRLSIVEADETETDKSKTVGSYLIPTPNFHPKTTNNTILKSSVIGYYKHGQDKVNTKFVCAYPLLITQNAYTANEFVNWYLDNGNELKPILMAGTLNTENKFTGVFFGDFKSSGANTGASDEVGTSGIYGFKNGVKTFGIDEDGNAYFKGRVEAAEGTIAGWNIGSNAIVKSVNTPNDTHYKSYKFFMKVPTVTETQVQNVLALYGCPELDGKGETSETKIFSVNSKGVLYAKGANIEGTFTINTNSKIGNNPVGNYATLDATKEAIKAEVVSQTGGTTSSFGWNLTSDSWTLSSSNKNVLVADKDGITINGIIHAKDGGTIGGWDITNTRITSGNPRTGHCCYLDSSAGNTMPFLGIYHIDKDKDGKDVYNYSVILKKDGSASFTGDIKATSGDFKDSITINGKTLSTWISTNGEIFKIKATEGLIGGWTITDKITPPGETSKTPALYYKSNVGDAWTKIGVYLTPDKLIATGFAGSTVSPISVEWYRLVEAAKAYRVGETIDIYINDMVMQFENGVLVNAYR